jgi:uncharacterized membrane protein YbhN (UPF0104 family)
LSFPLQRWLVWFGLACALYGAAIFALEQEQAGLAFTNLLSWHGLLAAGLCLLSYLLRGLRWLAWMRLQGRPLGLRDGLRFYLAGYAFTPTPGNLGEAVRGMLLVQQPLTLGRSLAVFGAERLADLMCLLLLALPVVGWLLPSLPLPLSIPLLALVVAMAVVLLSARGQRMLRQRLPWLADAWACLANRPDRWFTLTMLAWAAQGLAVWLLCVQAGLSLPPVLASAIYAAAMVGGALSMLPAGLGGTEALLVAMLAGQGASLGSAVMLTVMVRLLTLWFAVALGMACLFYSSLVRKDLRLDASHEP